VLDIFPVRPSGNTGIDNALSRQTSDQAAVDVHDYATPEHILKPKRDPRWRACGKPDALARGVRRGLRSSASNNVPGVHSGR
jgi:hypothetical protein